MILILFNECLYFFLYNSSQILNCLASRDVRIAFFCGRMEYHCDLLNERPNNRQKILWQRLSIANYLPKLTCSSTPTTFLLINFDAANIVKSKQNISYQMTQIYMINKYKKCLLKLMVI